MDLVRGAGQRHVILDARSTYALIMASTRQEDRGLILEFDDASQRAHPAFCNFKRVLCTVGQDSRLIFYV